MHCPLTLHRSPLQGLYSKGEIDFRVCKECGLVFRKNFPDDDELTEIYKNSYLPNNIESGGTQQESGSYAVDLYSRYLMKYFIKKNYKVLDFGAGSGEFVEKLKQNNIQAEGLEFSNDARSYCRTHRCFSLLSELNDVSANSVDIVIMIEVIEHLTDLHGTLKNIYRVMKPGGYIFITTPNRKGFRALIEGGFWREAQKKFHLFLFDNRSLKFHLEACGYKKISRIKFSPIPKVGLINYLQGRIFQLIGLHGSLCMVAKKPHSGENL